MRRMIFILTLLFVFAGDIQAGAVGPFVTIFMRGLLANPDAATGRSTLGLGAADSPTWTGATLSGDTLIVGTSKTPASASAAGTQGQIAWDASYIYVAVADNTWKRAALSTWTPATLGFLKKVDGGYLRQANGGKIDLQ